MPLLACLSYSEGACAMAQLVKNRPAVQETQVPSLDREVPLEMRKWQPTPAFLAGKSHGQRSLVGYSPWGRRESDMTEQQQHIVSFSPCPLRGALRLQEPSLGRVGALSPQWQSCRWQKLSCFRWPLSVLVYVEFIIVG